MQLQHLLARFARPLTYLLWVLVAIGVADYLFGPFLSPELAETGLIVMWVVAAATWFGWRQRKRDEAANRPPDLPG